MEIGPERPAHERADELAAIFPERAVVDRLVRLREKVMTYSGVACCDRVSRYVLGTHYEGRTIVGVLRCRRCERFSFELLGEDGTLGRPGWGRAAEWRRSVIDRAFALVYEPRQGGEA